jgi:transposase
MKDVAHARTHLRGVAAWASIFPRKPTTRELKYESQVSIAPGLAAMERRGRVRNSLGLEPELGVRSFRAVLAYLDELQEPRARINKQEKVMIQMKNNVKYLGVDCAKASFDSNLEDSSIIQSWENTTEGVSSFISKINQLGAEVVVIIESTGGYERLLLRSLYKEGIAVARVDPLRARRFAQSEGLRAKTDPIDARMLARFGREKNPALWQPPARSIEVLRQLVSRRRQISDMVKQEKTRLEQAEGFSRKDILSLIAILEKRERKIEHHIEAHIQSDKQLYELYQKLMLPKGIGPVTAYTIMAFMPELDSINQKRASSLAGVAPYTQSSGKYIGKAKTAGGRKEIRRPLHMAAKSAIRFNPSIRSFYLSLKSRGKEEKVAVVAVMHKLVILMHRIANDPEFILTT